jgi:hypothetical protein
MTDANGTPGPTPPGWYADPSGAAPLRWWDGTQWTAHVSQPTAPADPAAAAASVAAAPAAPVQYAPAGPAPRPHLDPATPVGTVWIWLVVLLPLLSIALVPFIHPDFTFALDTTSSQPVLPNYFDLVGGPVYFVLIGVGWLSYAATVVFSWLDHRELTRRGVVRPFHWAWSFLSSLVYVIGRTVIVRQVADRRGAAPLWAAIGVIAVSFIVTTVWSIWLINDVFTQIGRVTYGA